MLWYIKNIFKRRNCNATIRNIKTRNRKKYNINLSQYAWSEEINQQIFSTQLDENIETYTTTLKEIYEYGFNGLTSRYVCRKFNEATLFYGKANLLIGTKNSPNEKTPRLF